MIGSVAIGNGCTNSEPLTLSLGCNGVAYFVVDFNAYPLEGAPSVYFRPTAEDVAKYPELEGLKIKGGIVDGMVNAVEASRCIKPMPPEIVYNAIGAWLLAQKRGSSHEKDC